MITHTHTHTHLQARQRELCGGRDKDSVVLDLYEDMAYSWRSLQVGSRSMLGCRCWWQVELAALLQRTERARKQMSVKCFNMHVLRAHINTRRIWGIFGEV